MYHVTAAIPYDDQCHDMAGVSRQLGYDFVLLSRAKTDSSLGPYHHFLKLHLLMAEIKQNMMMRNSIIMCTDAYDILLLLPAYVIEARFRAMNCDFCFGTEANFHPAQDVAHPHAQLGTAYRDDVRAFYEAQGDSRHSFPNGGGWIGYGWAVERVLERVCAYAETYGVGDDQQAFQDVLYFNIFSDIKIKIDSKQKIFTSIMFNNDHLYMAGASVFSSETEWEAGLVHFNGHSGSWREFIGFYNEFFRESGYNGGAIQILRSQNGAYVCEEGGIITERDALCHDVVFCVSSPSGNFFLIKPQGELGTFNPHDGAINFSHCPLNAWEVQSGSDILTVLSERIGCSVFADFAKISEVVESGFCCQGGRVKTCFNMMV